MTLAKARKALRAHASPQKARVHRSYFKQTNDTFLGVPAQRLREVAREFSTLPLGDVKKLMQSKVHDEKSLSHAILVRQFEKGNETERGKIFRFYIRNRKFIHSWDGVDDSAPYIVGPYLLKRNKKILYQLARSARLWDRRIAIVSTWWFIRQGEIRDTLIIARLLLGDGEDLIHKAAGWMLREAGKRDVRALERFLRAHHGRMPRTMLRYAIERFPPAKRRAYLRGEI